MGPGQGQRTDCGENSGGRAAAGRRSKEEGDGETREVERRDSYSRFIKSKRG